jgi:hypothetical protein
MLSRTTQNMILWAVPAALEGKDLKGAMSLVERVLKAGKIA